MSILPENGNSVIDVKYIPNEGLVVIFLLLEVGSRVDETIWPIYEELFRILWQPSKIFKVVHMLPDNGRSEVPQTS